MEAVTENKREKQLADARAALAANGKSPRQLGLESRLGVLEWIYRWGYTSSAVIQTLLGKTSGGYAKKLVKQGWLSATKTESGTPAVIYTLTVTGLQEVERRASTLYQYSEIEPGRINQQLVRHNLLAQQSTANLLASSSITSYETERMFLQQGDKPGVKRPDVVWVTPSGLRMGVEIELSAKWGRDLDQFVLAIANALLATKDTPAPYGRFVVISDSPAIIKRYSEAMKSGAKLNVWSKNERKHWVVTRTMIVQNWLLTKVDFQLIGK